MYDNNGIVVKKEYGEIRLWLNGQLMGRMDADTGLPLSEYMLDVIQKAPSRSADTALVIGGGAYLIPSYYARMGAIVDVVEPLPEMDGVAIQYFRMIPKGPRRINRIHRDISLVPKDKKYDLISLDAYDGPLPVESLYSKESLDDLKSRCKKLLVNDIRRIPTVYEH